MLRSLARHAGRAAWGASASVSGSPIGGVPSWARAVSYGANGSRGWRNVGEHDQWAITSGSISAPRSFHTSHTSLAKPGRIKTNALLQTQHFAELGVVKPGEAEVKKRTGLLVIKCGMTREWNEHGVAVPLTVLWVDDCQVTQQKRDSASRGVFSLQLGAGSKKPKQVSNALRGHFDSCGVNIKREVAEFRVSEDAMLPVGTVLNASHFVAGQFVDITGFTIGKGFQGPMKRWGFSGLPATHGTTKKHRAHGTYFPIHRIPQTDCAYETDISIFTIRVNR
jgi:50S ribosomal protein uL3